jgi:hypothetical protein
MKDAVVASICFHWNHLCLCGFPRVPPESQSVTASGNVTDSAFARDIVHTCENRRHSESSVTALLVVAVGDALYRVDATNIRSTSSSQTSLWGFAIYARQFPCPKSSQLRQHAILGNRHPSLLYRSDRDNGGPAKAGEPGTRVLFEMHQNPPL